MLDYYKIGQRIRKYRKARGLSQEELAEKVEISTTHMSHIETGNTKLSLLVLTDISKSLDVSCDDIIFGETENNRSNIQNNILNKLETCNSNELKILEEIINSSISALKTYL